MNISSFFAYLKEHNFEGTDKVIYIKSKTYPVLFFAVCKKILQEKGMHIQTIDVHMTSEATLMAQLEMPFLAMNSMYWLTGFDQLDEKKRLKIINYCNLYRGSHALMVCIDNAVAIASHNIIITLDALDAITFTQLAALFYPLYAKRSTQLSTHIFKRNKTISFDSAWLLIHYSIVLGSSIDTFVHTWLDAIVEPEKSLFALSGAFFARKSSLFFGLWHAIKDDYPTAFWTTYWSEQLVRAYFYITHMQEQNIVEAKKVAYRLPFSFIQKDWHVITLPLLQKTHDVLYTLDYNSKNSVGLYGFELLFAQFFNA